jgi:uncharacterized RDD family membrane protein YckC
MPLSSGPTLRRRSGKARRGSAPPRAAPAKSGDAPPGLLRRLSALAYDCVLLVGLLFAATLAILPLRGGEAFRPHDPAYFAYLLAVGFLFFGWFWTHGGQTLGMRAWRIRLVAADGTPVSWSQAALRYVCALASLALLGLGYFWVWIDPHRRGWHDLAAGTRLVRQR